MLLQSTGQNQGIAKTLKRLALSATNVPVTGAAQAIAASAYYAEAAGIGR
jgi:hypothetical protein